MSVEDALGSIATYEYDVLGNLVKFTDPTGSVTTMTYNLNGQKLSKNDPNTGYSAYKYNAFNELMYSRNANGTEMRFERDLLGRMTKRIEPEGVTTWTYDTALHGVDKVAKIVSTASGYSIQMKYDLRGLPIEKTIKYNDSTSSASTTQTVYTLKTTYDNLGRVVSQVQPNGDVVYHCYNRYGYLAAVSTKDSSCESQADWRALDYDSFGTLRREIYANGLVNEYTLADNSQIQRVTTAAQYSSSYLRRIDYEFDKRQNLAQRDTYDETGQVTIEKFSYDVLNRLTFASTYKQLQKQQQPQLTESFSWVYDGMGNIQSYQEASGQDLLYNYDENKRQQAVQIGKELVEYDVLGNVINSCSYDIEWYSFSKPSVIKTPTVNGSVISFSYGPDRELIAKKLSKPYSPSLTTTIHFVSDLYEKWSVKNGSNLKIIEKFHVRVLGRIISTRIVTKSSSAPLSNNFVLR